MRLSVIGTVGYGLVSQVEVAVSLGLHEEEAREAAEEVMESCSVVLLAIVQGEEVEVGDVVAGIQLESLDSTVSCFFMILELRKEESSIEEQVGVYSTTADHPVYQGKPLPVLSSVEELRCLSELTFCHLIIFCSCSHSPTHPTSQVILQKHYHSVDVFPGGHFVGPASPALLVDQAHSHTPQVVADSVGLLEIQFSPRFVSHFQQLTNLLRRNSESFLSCVYQPFQISPGIFFAAKDILTQAHFFYHQFNGLPLFP